eukprot:364741-Chlamydomonas_euryale.AAC.9
MVSFSAHMLSTMAGGSRPHKYTSQALLLLFRRGLAVMEVVAHHGSSLRVADVAKHIQQPCEIELVAVAAGAVLQEVFPGHRRAHVARTHIHASRSTAQHGAASCRASTAATDRADVPGCELPGAGAVSGFEEAITAAMASAMAPEGLVVGAAAGGLLRFSTMHHAQKNRACIHPTLHPPLHDRWPGCAAASWQTHPRRRPGQCSGRTGS